MKNLLTILLLGWSLPTLADRLPLPGGTPASYKSECGSCHLPYSPALLAADNWRRIMGRLDDHFGSDATLASRQQQEIRTFLENAAGRNASAAPANRHAFRKPSASSASIAKFLPASGATRASNRPPTARPAIQARPRGITASTTSSFTN